MQTPQRAVYDDSDDLVEVVFHIFNYSSSEKQTKATPQKRRGRKNFFKSKTIIQP